MKAPFVGGAGRLHVRGHRELVAIVTRDTPLFGNHFGADALGLEATNRLVAVTYQLGERRAELTGGERSAHWNTAHHFDPSGNRDVVSTRDDALGGEVRGLLGGPALTVDRGGRHGFGPARSKNRVAPDVECLLAGLHDAAHDNVVDQCGVEVVTVDERLQDYRGEVDWVPVLELAAAASEGGADSIDDDCSACHWVTPVSWCEVREGPDWTGWSSFAHDALVRPTQAGAQCGRSHELVD